MGRYDAALSGEMSLLPLASWSSQVYGFVGPLLLHTPDVTHFAFIRSLWTTSLLVSGGLLVLMTTLAGLGIGVGDLAPGSLRTTQTFWHLFLTTSAMIFSLKIGSWAIQLNNAVISAFAAKASLQTVFAAHISFLGYFLWSIPYFVLGVLIAVTYVWRIMEISFLLIVQPLGYCLAVLPNFRRASTWINLELAATIFVQFLQAIVLAMSTALAQGLGLSNQAIPNLLFELALALVLLQLPGWTKRWFHGSGLGFADPIALGIRFLP